MIHIILFTTSNLSLFLFESVDRFLNMVYFQRSRFYSSRNFFNKVLQFLLSFSKWGNSCFCILNSKLKFSFTLHWNIYWWFCFQISLLLKWLILALFFKFSHFDWWIHLLSRRIMNIVHCIIHCWMKFKYFLNWLLFLSF